jgi:hypothetical protein
MLMPRVLIFLLLSGVAIAAQVPPTTAAAFLGHVRFLSADELEGRGNGSDGLERAAEYVLQQFRAAGLTGGGDRGTFDQRFEARVRVEPPATASLILDQAGAEHVLALGRDYYPLSVLHRPRGAAPPELREARVVFVGYGISAPGLGYDDFGGVDVQGAAVLMFTHEPQEHDERSVFGGRGLTPGAAISVKAREARERGARLLLVVDDPSHADDRAMRGAWFADPQRDALGLPVLRVARDRIARALPAFDLEHAATLIDRTLQPRSQVLPGISLSYVEWRAEFTAELRNVVGVLRGSDAALAREAIVVGAHYEHVGTGGEYSESPHATGEVHNGADDNASGTASLIELAKAAARLQPRLRRSVVFAAFAGEELGLLGSSHYASQPPIPLSRTTAMINLDMVGRARGRVMVGLFGTSTRFPGLIGRMRPWTTLALHDFTKGGYAAGASDTASFANRGVPSIAFFTGFHSDYHRPSDDWASVDAEGGAEVTRLALRLVADLAR